MNPRNWLMLSLALLISGCSVFGMHGVDKPGYQVEVKEGDIEIRVYPQLLVAETEVQGNYEEIGKEGFQRLSGYIFGKNSTEQEIAMTAPVLQEGTGDQWRMTFVMPDELTESTAPKPNDDQVTVKNLPGKRVAALKYSGSVSAEIITEKGNELQTWLDERGYKAISPVRSARYDPPWTLPMFRHNEVQIDVK